MGVVGVATLDITLVVPIPELTSKHNPVVRICRNGRECGFPKR